MNENHAKLCPSPEWAAHIQNEVLPALVAELDLGKELLEIGPGPGAATDWLRRRVGQLTAIEVDREAAALLAARFARTNVEIVTGDASALGFPDESFDSVGTFTMLHHVPTVQLQFRVLAEACRVLRPGGVLFGSDSLASTGLHEFHAGDTYNPVEPASLLSRLQALGFDKITVAVDGVLKFTARKPESAADRQGCGSGGPAGPGPDQARES